MAALSSSTSCTFPGGGEFSFNIATDNVEVAQDVLKTVQVVGKAVVTLGALYFGYKLLKPVIESAVTRGLGGERDDQDVRGIRPGSLHVQLYCSTDQRFLEVLTDYKSGRMKERLHKEFLQVGIKVKGLKVEIENMVKVNETKQAISKRYHVNRDLCEDVKNVVIAYAKSNVDKHVQSSRSEEKLPSTSSFEIDVDSATHSTSPQEESVMKPLPRDERALFQEAYSLGLIGPNPDLRKPRAKLINHINSSKMIGRSMNHVSILLFGESGVGISATINHLLRTKDEIAKTSSGLSQTRCTQEFIVYGSEPRYEVEELPLGVVDTPGFADTGGFNQDACNFFSMQEFFRTHPKLTGHYPNLIFLVVKATDNRFSEFVRWLECIKLHNLVDPNNPNVVAVITHVCKIPNRKLDKWSKIMETKKTTVKRIIFDALKVTAPVVLLENMYGEEGYDLDVDGDYTRLPNGVLQPKNLYDACADVLKNNNDNLGLITLNSIFAPSTKVPPPKHGHKIEAKNAKSRKLDDEEIALVDVIKSAARGESVMPIMKPLPRDKKTLFVEAHSLGLIGPNPDLQKPRAKLVDYINSSGMTGRSMNHVSILLVGESGVGKSCTINHLLGTKDEIAKTNDSKSETRSTQEFIVYGSEPRYEVKDLPLGVVDTPGFGDTDGSYQDACNFFSIQEFFRTHPKLTGHYPNLIFLVVNATDTRLKGENSHLTKSLRCVKLLKLVDPINPNVVAVMTHACGSPSRNVDIWCDNMEKIKTTVKTIIFEALKVTAPVIVMENLYGEKGYDLEEVGEYTRLPNGVLQPKNLYDACADVLKENNDNLGLIILNSIFAPSTKVPRPKDGHKIEAKNAKIDKLDDEEIKFVDVLERRSRGEFRDPIVDTVLQYIQEKKIEPREEEELREIVIILRNLGVGDPPNFESLSVASIEYFHGKEISSTGRTMLQEKFEIAMEPLETAFDTGSLVGQGYNILTDRSVATQVFKFDATKTQYGIAIPKCAKFEKVQQTRNYMDQFENYESYTESRLKNLNVSIGVNPNVLKMGNRAGYNRDDYSTSSEVSFLFEQRMFEIKFGNYEEYLDEGVTFTKDFRSAVGRLPCTYDKNDPSCRSSFEGFFNRFGHFLVSSAYGGGSVEVKCSREMVGSATASLAEVKAVLTAIFEGLDVDKTEFTAGTSLFDSVNANTLLERCHIFWEGGHTILREKETIADKEKMKKWKASLLVKPAILTTEMTLEPISVAVAHVDPEKDKTTYDALKDLLGGEFKVLDEEEQKRAAEARAKKKEKEEQKRAAQARAKKMGEATIRKETVQDPNEREGGCFPSSSVVNVRSKNGVVKQKKMVKLEVGDKVMGWDEKRNRAVFTEIIMFAHRASDAVDVEYMKIALEDRNKITLSGNHLVMVGKHKKAILARKVKRGEILFTVDENRKISPKKVLAVDKVIEQGVYCPITVHGNLIVDNVLASCYASVQDHVFLEGLVKISAQSIAHFGLVPMRALHKFRLKWWRKIPNGQTIHPYLQWLCKLKLPFMAN